MASSLNKGIEAAKSGLMEEALGHLKDAIVEEPDNADVWVWLSAIIEDEEKQTVFLKKALDLDPGNRPAQRGLAFIERKKYIPPKPGEKLSDYTHPIGIFNSPPVSPEQAAANIAAENSIQGADKPETSQQTTEQDSQPFKAQNTKRKPWLDVLLYGFTLMAFIIIGILIGSTLLNIEIPWLNKPAEILSVYPKEDGVFLLENNDFTSLPMKQAQPESHEDFPVSKVKQPNIILNLSIITLDDRLELRDMENQALPYLVTETEKNMHLLSPKDELAPGAYCLVYALNPSKGENLYWCLNLVQE